MLVFTGKTNFGVNADSKNEVAEHATEKNRRDSQSQRNAKCGLVAVHRLKEKPCHQPDDNRFDLSDYTSKAVAELLFFVV